MEFIVDICEWFNNNNNDTTANVCSKCTWYSIGIGILEMPNLHLIICLNFHLL